MDPVIGAGVIGVGILGSRHARVYAEQSRARLVAVADPRQEVADDLGSRYGARSFANYREMLDKLGPAGSGELQVVSVATPDFLHAEPVRACLEAGVDVLVEKPLTTDLTEARSLVDLARSRGRVLMVNYSQRWLPEHRRIEAAIADGTLGPVAFVESHRWDAAWVPGRMISWASKTTPIHFMSSHDIDLILHWLGERVVSVSASAHYGALQRERGLEGTVDGYVAQVRFEGGAIASLHSSWILPSTFPSAADTYLEVLGARGAAFLTGNGRELRLYTDDRTERDVYGGPATATEQEGRIVGAFTSSVQSFLAAARDRDLEAATSAGCTLHVVEVQDAIVRAAESGEIVRLGGTR